MQELYINEELIDLVPGQDIAMTYQISDIGDISSQRANYSNQLKAPRTKENSRKLGYVDQLSSSDMRPYRQLPARLIQDGEETIRNGLAMIKSTNEYFNIVIYSGLIDFFETIGDASITDLDLSDLNHQWSLSTVQSLVASQSGIAYPLINYGAIKAKGRELLANYQFFSIYVKELFDRIFLQAGFEKDGSFLSHPDYPKLLLPFSSDSYIDSQKAEGNSFSAYGEMNITENILQTQLQFPTILSGNQNDLFDGVNFFIPLSSSPVRGKLKLSGKFTSLNQTQEILIRMVSSTKGVLYQYKEVVNTGLGLKDFSAEIELSDYEPGELINVFAKPQNPSAMGILATIEFEANEALVFGSSVPVAQNLPDIKQKDLLKAVAQMYGLIYEQDENQRLVRIRQFDELQANKGDSIDWSAKLDLSQTPEVSFDIGYSKTNYLKYKKDDNVTAGYGDGFITVDNDNLTPTKTLTTVPFSASLSNLYLNGLELIDIIQFVKSSNAIAANPYDAGTSYTNGDHVIYNGSLWEYTYNSPAAGKTPGTTTVDGSGASYWTRNDISTLVGYERKIKTQPRILLAKKVTLGDSLTLKDEQTGESVIISGDVIIPYFSNLVEKDTLDFTSLIEKNYKTVQDVAWRTKFLKAYFNLSGNDVKNFDFLTPRYVGYFGSFFYVNKIDKYIKGKSTSVEMVRV